MLFIGATPTNRSKSTLALLLAVMLVASGAALSQNTGSWTRQSPLPTGTSLQSVDMVSDNEAWAVGYGGVVIHTNDGGATWQTQNSGTTEPLYIVRFVDSLHGWAGSNNTVLYTSDGGATWRQGAGILGSVYGLGFADANNGFAAENVSIIYRTRDGGRTWTQVRVPITISGFRFFDASNGVAIGNGVLHTSDGGNTWVLQSGSNQSGFFIDPTEGWNVLNAAASHTTDGGSNWVPQTLPSNAFVYGRYFTDSLNGWAVGAQQDIIHTSDGGNTWTTQMGGINSGANNFYTFWDTSFADAQHGMAVGDTGLLFTTIDGGVTWTNRQSGSGTETLGMAATDANHLWASQVNGEVLKTVDGGKHWTRSHAGPVSMLAYGVSFADNLNGWTVLSDAQAGAGQVYRSSDGGSNWTLQTSRRELYAVKAVSSSTVVAVGGDSFGPVLVRSTNGGATWAEDDTLPAGVLYGLTFVNSTTGWAVGYFGTIIKTTDAGVTWIPQASGTTLPLLAASFADSNNGWVVGDGGVVLHTTNGGATWLPQIPPVPNNFISVFAVSPSVAWIGGYNSIARTLDGGQTWSQETVATDNPTSYSGLYFVDADNGWTGGFSGIFRRTSAGADFSTLTLNPASMVSGSNSTGTVTLVSPAPPGGTVVTLTSSNTLVAKVPASVTVPAGATQATFTVITKPLNDTTLINVTAADNSGSISATLTLTPFSLTSLTLKPTSVKGGTSSQGTVTTNGPAPANGVKVRLFSGNTTVATVPASVTIAAGATSATFTVKTKAVTSNTFSSIVAKAGASAQAATLTVTP